MNDDFKIIDDIYNQSQANQSISAKLELASYGTNLTTEDKLNVLKIMVIDLNSDVLSRVSNRKQRIPTLAKKQVLEECIDILKKYYVVDEILGEQE